MNKRLNNKQGKKRVKIQKVDNVISLGEIEVMDSNGDIYVEEVNVYTLDQENFFDVIEVVSAELYSALDTLNPEEVEEERMLTRIISFIKNNINDIVSISTDISEDSCLTSPVDTSKFLVAFLKLNNVSEILSAAFEMMAEFSSTATEVGKQMKVK